MHKTLRIAISLALIGAIGLSCRKDGTGPSWDVDILAPIMRTSLSLKNLVADSLLTEGADNALIIAYDGTVFRLSIDTLVEIPDTSVTQTFLNPLTNSVYLQPGDPIPFFGSQQETKYDLKQIELKKVKIRSGTITFDLSSSIQEVVELSYFMQYATKGGVPFSMAEQIPAGTQSSPASISRTYDLKGYEIDMTGINGNDFNTLVAEFAAIISPAATGSVEIATNDQFEMTYTFNNIIAEYAEGYFGSYTISSSYTDTFNIFNNILSGYLNIDSMSLKMNIDNGFGIDAQFTIDTVRSTNSKTGVSAELNHSSIGNSINLTRALNTGTFQTPFTYSEYSISMNTGNSNIDELIENIPNHFTYAFNMEINPFGNNSNGNDFMYYDSDVRISVDLTVPARFSANGLTIVDTVDLDMHVDPEKDHETTITGGYFYLFADNGFPFDAKLQLYLYDDNFMLLDSLLLPPNNVIAAAPVDFNYKVSEKLVSQLDIPVDDDKMIVFDTMNKAVVKVVFTTQPANQVMTIYSDYSIDLKLVGDFTYKVQTE